MGKRAMRRSARHLREHLERMGWERYDEMGRFARGDIVRIDTTMVHGVVLWLNRNQNGAEWADVLTFSYQSRGVDYPAEFRSFRLDRLHKIRRPEEHEVESARRLARRDAAWEEASAVRTTAAA